MGITDMLRALWRPAGKQAEQPAFALPLVTRAHFAPRNYESFAREGYAGNAIVFRCVNEIAVAASSVHWNILAEGKALAGNHPLCRLLSRPAPGMSGAALLESLAAYRLIAGNAYVEAVGPAGGAPRELHVLRPDHVRVLTDRRGRLAGYEHETPAGKRRLPCDPLRGLGPVLHLAAFNPLDEHYGLAPTEAAAAVIDSHNAQTVWNKALLDNAARPSGALVVQGNAGLGPEQFERLKAEIEARFSGAMAAGRPMLLEGGLQWQEMSFSPRDMDFRQAREAHAREIALAFGVPPLLLGLPGDNTYANYREARLALWEQTVLPLVQDMAAHFEAWLAPRFGRGITIRPDPDRISALAPRREKLHAMLEGASYMSEDEKRAAAGLPPRPLSSGVARDGE